MGGLNINHRLFRLTGLAGLGVLLIILAIVAGNMKVYGLQLDIPNQHIGGFMVEANQIKGTGFILTSVINDSNAADSAEQHMLIRVSMENFETRGMKIVKVLHSQAMQDVVRAATLGAYDALKIEISSADENAVVGGTGLVMDTSAMTSNLANFYMLNMNSPTDMEASATTITDAQIISHFLSADTLKFPFMIVKIEPCSSSEDPCL